MPVRILFVVMMIVGGASVGRAVGITGGPMVGHVTEKSARVWMQLDTAGQVTVSTFETPRGTQVGSLSEDVEGPWPFVCDIPVSNLQPNKTYRVEVRIDGNLVDVPGPGVVIRTAPAAGAESVFTVAFGSGLGSESAGTLFKSVQEIGPRAFLFLGNTGALPGKLEGFPTARRTAFRFIAGMHAEQRKRPELQELLRSTACYGIWGEHDFGTDGAGSDFVFGQESLTAFQRFWANPDWGTPENAGCYFSFTLGDADFFMLDSRMYRDSKTMLGAAQLEWLKKSLKASTATFKIIGCANRLLTDDGGRDEWARYAEQKEFFKWLKDEQIHGVFFVAGCGDEQRYGELSEIRPSGGAPLVEMVTGPLSGVAGNGAAENSFRAGSAVADANFGTLEFSGEREHRFMRLRLRDASGKVRVEQTIYVANLQ